MKNATMLYKSPGPHTTDGISYEYTIVDEHEVEESLAAGWRLTWVDAAQARLAENEQALAEVEDKLADAKPKKTKG